MSATSSRLEPVLILMSNLEITRVPPPDRSAPTPQKPVILSAIRRMAEGSQPLTSANNLMSARSSPLLQYFFTSLLRFPPPSPPPPLQPRPASPHPQTSPKTPDSSNPRPTHPPPQSKN